MAPAKKNRGKAASEQANKTVTLHNINNNACRSRRRNHKGGHGWLLASIVASTVVKKRDASSLRDVELTAVYQVYRPCVGWKTRNDHAKSVQESVSATRIFEICMGNVGVRFQVGLRSQNKPKKYIFSRLYTLYSAVKQRVGCTRHSVKQRRIACVISENQLSLK